MTLAAHDTLEGLPFESQKSVRKSSCPTWRKLSPSQRFGGSPNPPRFPPFSVPTRHSERVAVRRHAPAYPAGFDGPCPAAFPARLSGSKPRTSDRCEQQAQPDDALDND